MALTLRQLDASADTFSEQIRDYIAQAQLGTADIDDAVRAIIDQVRTRGDAAVLEYTERFDKRKATSVAALRITEDQRAQAAATVAPEWSAALSKAAERIRRYAERQLVQDWEFVDEFGVRLGQKVSAIDSVGLYIPGGKAAYPSSVLMNAIPAQVAGVERIVAMLPACGGELNPFVMCALQLMSIDEAYTIGGAQAIAVLAYGTQSIAPVVKIVGPGNAYVNEAKRQVFGKVGIDMVAGPSEILVIADGSTQPSWIALDLFSQAEHDEQARSILLCPDADYLNQVKAEIDRLLPTMARRKVIEAALNRNGLLVKVDDLQQAMQIANIIAAEHLELAVVDAERWLDSIKNAGAVFLGSYSCEVLGDYCAGSNHVLPTAGSARFSSPLGVYDFQKRTGIMQCDAKAASYLATIAEPLAEAEGLHAHAAAARSRITAS
ncbi:MAG: histidinol dehydrogenase [Chromatiales bacterium]|nr:histidinol dehydrogenase [Chromatiales bacterium]